MALVYPFTAKGTSLCIWPGWPGYKSGDFSVFHSHFHFYFLAMWLKISSKSIFVIKTTVYLHFTVNRISCKGTLNCKGTFTLEGIRWFNSTIHNTRSNLFLEEKCGRLGWSFKHFWEFSATCSGQAATIFLTLVICVIVCCAWPLWDKINIFDGGCYREVMDIIGRDPIYAEST